ncbi:AI-2E family transporter [Aquabacter spiritensis]|uniref:Putative PurR-regulated permease PerM n=1 Tax=Aquabacter spiritensis TaxID=933073 RepID=A0A4R3LSJ8_9HYPH|nr:AI-2E family transporter [Aquabacter spiritensis]TCT01565.1 putative PurR-regulated permease PerM [Aquabacter spiritensis]
MKPPAADRASGDRASRSKPLVIPDGLPKIAFGTDKVNWLIGFVTIVAMLYFARDVLVPIALAVLLSFVLAPLILGLRRLRLPRTLSVIVVVAFAFVGIVTLGGVVASQIVELATDLPRYQQTMREKIRTLKDTAEGSGTFDRLGQMFQDLGREIDRPDIPAPGGPMPSATSADPLPVEIHDRAPGTIGMLQSVIEPLVHPLATTGIIIIFVIFILLQREDLRNRFIRLAGAQDIQRTTAALDEAAARLSRFFLTQVALNAAFGTVIGFGLWVIGVPSPALWGLLAGVLRFVPYVGAIIAALLPITLAMAVDPGWSIVVWTVVLFAVVEPLVGHIIEPMVYGRSTGLSPVAVVVCATFWTWLWGPIGLVLSTPLTLCLVVLGRHVDQLDYLDVMLGDRPALSASELFYQRMLASDPTEATSKAEEFLKEGTLLGYLDEVALPGLRLAERDAERGSLDDERVERLRTSVSELLDNLSDYDDVARDGDTHDVETEAALDESGRPARVRPRFDPSALPERWQGATPVLSLALRSGLDAAAAAVAADLVGRHGLVTRLEGPDQLSSGALSDLGRAGFAVAMLSTLETRSAALMRYSVRRLRRRIPGARIILCAWGAQEDRAFRTTLETGSGADIVATTMDEMLAGLIRLAAEETGTPPTDGREPNDARLVDA